MNLADTGSITRPGSGLSRRMLLARSNNIKATLLFNFGAEMSIIDTIDARMVGCIIDESQRQECIGIVETPYMTI